MERIVFIHVSKTAGSALKRALASTYRPSEVCPYVFEDDILKHFDELSGYLLFAAHLGFDTATKLGGRTITVLRDPIDRLESLYNFWHFRKPKQDPGGVFELVRDMTFEEFLRSDDRRVIPGRDNAMTYQLACSHNAYGRRKLASMSQKEVLGRAKRNLERIDVVGFQDAMESLAKVIQKRFGVEMHVEKENVTKHGYRIDRGDDRLMRQVWKKVELDMELVEFGRKRHAEEHA